MDGVRDAVAAGAIDQRFIDAARGVARLLTRTRPSPTGASNWADGEIDDLVFDAIGRANPHKIVLAANEAANDAQFSEWLRRLIRSELNLRARRTPAGRIIRALDDALSEAPERFVRDGERWQLAGDPRPPGWNQGNRPLLEAALAVTTTTMRITDTNSKAPILGARVDVRRIADAVLQLAGPLERAQLGEVLAGRFSVAFEDRFGYLDLDAEEEGPDLAPPDGEPLTDLVDHDAAARWMLEQLTADEQQALELLTTGSIRDLADRQGIGKYKAETIHRRLVAKLAKLAQVTGDDGQAATERLLAMVRQHEQLRHSIDHDGADDDE